jgi:hypothetical protein
LIEQAQSVPWFKFRAHAAEFPLAPEAFGQKPSRYFFILIRDDRFGREA